MQLECLEKKLSKDEELWSKNSKNINDDVEKGYLFRIENPKDPSQLSKREWYLPHHPVINPNKPGKIRRVLNGAAKFHGTSLNRSLLTGPDVLQRLIHTLIRFRQLKYAVSADIEGMFLQVGVPLASALPQIFVAGGPIIRTDGIPIQPKYLRCEGFTNLREFCSSENSKKQHS